MSIICQYVGDAWSLPVLLYKQMGWQGMVAKQWLLGCHHQLTAVFVCRFVAGNTN